MVVLATPATMLRDQDFPLPPTDPDHKCRQQIQELLSGQRQQDFREVLITSERGIVTLQGRVASFYLRQLCIRCCQQVVGGFQINDQLQVGGA